MSAVRRQRAGETRRSLGRRVKDESGQALMLALIVVVMFGLVPIISLTVLRTVQPQVDNEMASDVALAAAQAGLQEYRNLLDQYTDYIDWSGAKEPPASDGGCNPAFTNATSPCSTSWVSVNPATDVNTAQPESFEYSPNDSQLTTSNQSAPFYHEMLVTVIGRAGSGSGAVYRRIEAALQLSGAVNDVYFSTFEQPGSNDYDQFQNTCYVGTSTCLTSGSDEFDEATVKVALTNQTAADPAFGDPYAQALCQYDAYQPNAFVDWYSQYVNAVYPPSGYPNGGTPYNTTTNQYYGPWYSTWADPQGNGKYQFGGKYDGGACKVNFYIGGETFDGPVYSQDEVTTCGSPTFEVSSSSSADPLTTAAPEYFQFPTGWPGTNSKSQDYGYVPNLFGCGSGYPNFYSVSGTTQTRLPASKDVQFGTVESLPPIADELDNEIKDGTLLGCVYTGPTALRFYYDPLTQSETMYVWSPLTKDTYADTVNGVTAQCGNVATNGPQDLCGGSQCTYDATTGLPTNTQVSDTTNAKTNNTVQTAQTDIAAVPVVPGTVIWVQNLPSYSAIGTDPNAWSTVPTAESNNAFNNSPNCIDPWTEPNYIGSSQCNDGDVMIGGVTHGGLTIGSSANIILSQSLVYSCALGSSTQANPGISGSSSISNCGNSPDVTGLIADTAVWMADCGATASSTGPCANGNSATTSYSTCSDSDISTPLWSDMIPDTCYEKAPIIDAAIAALGSQGGNGFFEVQNFEFASATDSSIMTINGSQEVYTAGQYGTFTPGNPPTVTDGYYWNLNYDSRLDYQPPPAFLQAIGAIWEVATWISCSGTAAPTASNASSCSGLSS